MRNSQTREHQSSLAERELNHKGHKGSRRISYFVLLCVLCGSVTAISHYCVQRRKNRSLAGNPSSAPVFRIELVSENIQRIVLLLGCKKGIDFRVGGIEL